MSASQTAKPELPKEEKAIVEVLSQLGEKPKLAFAKPNRVKIITERENILEVARFVRDNLHFDHCTNVTGTDFPKDKQIEITYHFGAIDEEALRRIILAVSCRVPSNDAKLPTIISEYPSAELHERETAEMLGVNFVGHPDLSRLLLPEDWTDIPPMLKAYRLPGRLEVE